MDTDARSQLVLEDLEVLLRQGRSLDEAARRLAITTGDRALVEQVLLHREEIVRERQNIAIHGAVTNPEDVPPPWYTGPQPGDVYWPSLRAALESDPKWVDAVPSLDESSSDVVSLLAPPFSPEIRTRGLVVGFVQSGKTANFTATIAKAADAGYRLFIILSGVHNALRRQTQLRLDEQLHDLNPLRWLPLTDEIRDFGNPMRALPLIGGTDLRLTAVVKKNASRLTRLRDWLLRADRAGGLDTCPVLVIDDECDQASPNAARNADLDRTRINALIGELLALPRVAYLGYTATPFANVLINPADAQSIYPRSFIYSLPKPATYFGADELFGADRVEDEETPASASHDMIRTIPSGEADAQLSFVRADADSPEVTPMLDAALRWFVLATAARRVRTGAERHSSMLVHTTMRVAPQLALVPVLRNHIRILRSGWTAGERNSWREQWEEECRLEPAARHSLPAVSFSDLELLIEPVLSSIRVVADNSGSMERLIYTDDPATVVAVGGNTLSRGLTLEGLVSSYFLRTAGAYDALLQMGRWFGYRPGYADLPRIWTTERLANDFRFLADVEREIRHEIDRYRTSDATPLDLPVRIRSHPRMQITAPNKMQFAVTAAASYGGQRPQSTYFLHRDASTIRSNWTAAMHLIEGAVESGSGVTHSPSRIVISDVAADAILEFVEDFAFHEDTDLRSNLVAAYVRNQLGHGRLHRWNVAVITRANGPTRDLGPLGAVPLIERSRLKRSSSETTANIGTLMSKADRVADLLDPGPAARMTDRDLQDRRDEDGRGLLLLYPINRESRPRQDGAADREPLDAVEDLLGVAFSFPNAAPTSLGAPMVMVDPQLLGEVQTDEVYQDSEGDHVLDLSEK